MDPGGWVVESDSGSWGSLTVETLRNVDAARVIDDCLADSDSAFKFGFWLEAWFGKSGEGGIRLQPQEPPYSSAHHEMEESPPSLSPFEFW